MLRYFKHDGHYGLAPIWLLIIQIQVICNCSVQALNTCWSYNDTSCIVQTILHHFANSNKGDNITLEMDCELFQNNDLTHLARSAKKTNTIHKNLFEHSQNITLNGCHTSLNAPHGYGLPFVPYCNKFQQITIEKFHDNDLQQLYCLESITEQELLYKNESDSSFKTTTFHLRSNQLGGIASNSLLNFKNLQKLYFESNSLRHIHHEAFKNLDKLEIIWIKNEERLTITDNDLFKHTNISFIYMHTLRCIAPEFFHNLPETIRSIYLAETHIEGNAVEFVNYINLKNISIINCGIDSFSISDCSNVKHINMSSNSIVNLNLFLNTETETHANNCALEILDLSGNNLTNFPKKWLHDLKSLRSINLRDNYLKTIDIRDLLSLTPQLQVIDLSANHITSFAEPFLEAGFDNIRIRMDRNPWNCIWLFNFAHAHPEKFGVFEYDKYISKINVNGLECQPENRAEDKAAVTAPEQEESAVNERRKNPNNDFGVIGKFPPKMTQGPNNNNNNNNKHVYALPWDLKRNQKAEALIIVFLLPVGIAFLFLLLYMWIHCQKIFHLAFYRSLSFLHRDEARCSLNINERATSFDYKNNNDGYETPQKDVSMCDCKLTSTESAMDMCHEIHYVTYEPIPNEPPSKLYEEIYEDVRESKEHVP